MSSVFPIIMAVLLAAVVVVLLLGVVSMARGGSFNKKHGNKLMRARVGLQALAIVVLGVVWLIYRR